MKTLVILSGFFCAALCYPSDLHHPVQDTPEVAAAKSKHLAAHAEAKHRLYLWKADDRSWNNSEDDGSWKDDRDGSWKHHDDSEWKDETKKSWNHHSDVSHYAHHDNKWTGPVALPPGYDKNGAPLQVLDTPEVAAAKSKHFSAHANVKYSSSSWEAQENSWDKHDDGSWEHHDDGEWKDDTNNSWNHQSTDSHYVSHDKKWNGPVALPPGYDKHGAPLPVKDTPEVAAEKSKHFHLYAHAAAHSHSLHDPHA